MTKGEEGVERRNEEVEALEVETLVVEAVTVPADIEELISLEAYVNKASTNMDIIDLYEVGHEKVTCKLCEDGEKEIPFTHQIKIHGLQGEIVQLSALFDGAAMVAAMCTSLFKLVKHCIGKWHPSRRRLRMVNGMIVLSQARWERVMELKDISINVSFDIFDSGGSWAFLLGKPLL